MKKIATLFEREFLENHKVRIKPVVNPGFEWVLNGEGVATIKFDGACCAIINGELYKRYDAKGDKPIPDGAIKCQEKADPVTGHLPCWVKCDRIKPDDKWFWADYDNVSNHKTLDDGTYEAIGVHFRDNPYHTTYDYLIKHGEDQIDSNELSRTFEGIRDWLSENNHEGIVFWKDGAPQCKIKASDFGINWRT